MTMISPDNPLGTLAVAGFQPTPGTRAFRLESLDSALLASALEVSLDGFLLFNSDLRCLSANQAACEILGRSLEHISGQSLQTFFADADQEARLLTQTGRWSTVIWRASGETCEVECTQAVVEQGGHIQGVLMMRDVNESSPGSARGEDFEAIGYQYHVYALA